MSEMIRCTCCKGAKVMIKLGGISGDCNLCKGKGEIKASDKHVAVKIEPITIHTDILKQVENSVPTIIESGENTVITIEPIAKIDPKRAMYKRKKG